MKNSYMRRGAGRDEFTQLVSGKQLLGKKLEVVITQNQLLLYFLSLNFPLKINGGHFVA